MIKVQKGNEQFKDKGSYFIIEKKQKKQVQG